MQHRVTSAAPVSSSRCGYRARVSLKAACIFASFVLLPLPVSVVCVCRCCGNCAALLLPDPQHRSLHPWWAFFFFSSSRVCQGHAALLRVVSVAKLTSVSHFQLLPSCLVYLRARFPRLSRTSRSPADEGFVRFLRVRNSQTAPRREAVRGDLRQVSGCVCVFVLLDAISLHFCG